VATLHILGIVLRMISPHPATNPLIPSDALTEIQQDRPRRVRFLALLVVLDDLRRQSRRAVALFAADSLGVVGLIAMHPSEDRRIVPVSQAGRILRANHVHAMLLKRGQLLIGRPSP